MHQARLTAREHGCRQHFRPSCLHSPIVRSPGTTLSPSSTLPVGSSVATDFTLPSDPSLLAPATPPIPNSIAIASKSPRRTPAVPLSPAAALAVVKEMLSECKTQQKELLDAEVHVTILTDELFMMQSAYHH